MKTLTVVKDKAFESNYITDNIVECVNFWNTSDSYKKNLTGEHGDSFTQAKAQEQEQDDFLLNCIMADLKAFCNSEFALKSGDSYDFGRTRTHAWLHKNGERLMMIASTKFL